MQEDDDRVDAMVRAASAFPVDAGRMTQGVLARMRDDEDGVFGVFGSHLRGAALAFGVVLAAVPVLMTQVPSAVEDAVIASLLLGDGVLDDTAFDGLLTDEAVE